MSRPRVPATETLLATWERGRLLGSGRRALLLLAMSLPDVPPTDLAAVPVGGRNRLLAATFELLFGTWYRAVADCPGCGAELEADIPVGVFTGDDPAPGRPVPTAGDLAELDGLPADEAARELLDRYAPEGDEEMAAELAAADPDAVLSVATLCPDCGRPGELVLDPVVFLWNELDDWAWQLLRDVHELAAAHGWAEAEILAMSPWRRAAYLDLLAEDGAR